MLMVHRMLRGLLLHLWMRLLLNDHRGWRLLKDHLLLLLRFADRFLLLLLVRFDLDRWGICQGRNDRSSAGSGHFRCGWNYWNHRVMRRRWRKMWWWIDDGLHWAASTCCVDELVRLLLLLLSG